MRQITMPGWALIGAMVLAIVAAAPASAVPPKTVAITIGGMMYAPQQQTVKIGATVEWINKDVVDHTSTDKASTAAWNVSIAPGKSAKVVMKKAGTYDYFCRYHPNMTARLVVK